MKEPEKYIIYIIFAIVIMLAMLVFGLVFGIVSQAVSGKTKDSPRLDKLEQSVAAINRNLELMNLLPEHDN